MVTGAGQAADSCQLTTGSLDQEGWKGESGRLAWNARNLPCYFRILRYCSTALQMQLVRSCCPLICRWPPTYQSKIEWLQLCLGVKSNEFWVNSGSIATIHLWWDIQIIVKAWSGWSAGDGGSEGGGDLLVCFLAKLANLNMLFILKPAYTMN